MLFKADRDRQATAQPSVLNKNSESAKCFDCIEAPLWGEPSTDKTYV